jgi:photosystem II stability/assembly factor-like uncharacterized protein
VNGLRRAPHALALAVTLLAASTPARANGRFPRADQLVQVPGRPGALWLRATFGLLYSADAGQSWDWVCERAVGFTGQEDPALGVLPDGTVLAGLGAGLSTSRDGGCSWAFDALPSATVTGDPGAADAGDGALPLPVTDVSVRAAAPSTAVALAWEPQPVTATTPGYRTRFFATSDGGASWVAYGAGLDPSVLGLTLDVAPSDPHRLYASGIRPGQQRSAALFVSTDDGATWTERPVPFDTRSGQGLYIAAVDPNDADLVYLRTSGATSSRLLVTRDAGATFEKPFAGGPMLGFALTPDGTTIYLGGLDDGLWVGPSDTLVFERRSDLPLQCLLHTADALYACSSDLAGGFTVGASTDGGYTFSPRLFLSSVRGPLACDAASATAACASDWPTTAQRLGIDGVGGGSANGSNGAGASGAPGSPGITPAPSATDDGSGCGLSRRTRAAREGWLGAAFAIGLAAERRRRGRRRH